MSDQWLNVRPVRDVLLTISYDVALPHFQQMDRRRRCHFISFSTNGYKTIFIVMYCVKQYSFLFLI